MRRQRGNCGGAFGADAPGARYADGRWHVPASETCGALAQLGAGAEDEPLFRCPVALAQAAYGSPSANVYASTGERGIPLPALGYTEPLSEGTADGAHTMAAAWLWRQRLDLEAQRAQREASRG